MNNKIKNISMYNLTSDFENLYNGSKNNNNIYNLMSIITDERNIRLAYREIKSNKGSKTFGVDKKTIDYLKNLSEDECINLVQNKLKNYSPNRVRKIYISKMDGSKRCLGIPTITDRLVQQCIKQVMEAWCEPRFYNHSYGFRPLRSPSHALSRIISLINRGKCYYAVKFDIQSFFDEVDHKLLIEKIWNFGIRDKKLISIIKTIIGKYNSKGLTQGGILSPLLANIYLTDLDRWVETQWEHFPCKRNVHSFHNKKTHNLKHGYIVRYADDFVLMTKSYKDAVKWEKSITQYLDKRLHLKLNDNKTKIYDLKNKYFEFLGFKIKVITKGKTKNGFVAKTHISDKALLSIQSQLHDGIKNIQNNSYTDRTSIEYNLMVMGIKNYYKYATMVYIDLDKIGRGINRSMKVRLSDRGILVKYNTTDQEYKKQNIGLQKDTKIYKIKNTFLHVINAVHHKNPMNYQQDMNIYTKKGRALIKDNNELSLEQIKMNVDILIKTSNKYLRNSMGLADNRIRLYLANKGKSYVTGRVINVEEYHCHHKIPVKYGGTHDYKNLILLSEDEHKLVHATNPDIIAKYLKILNLNKAELNKINILRKFVKLSDIIV